MIRFQYSVGTVQSPRLQSREVDDEAPSNTSPDNARSYSLPPSSSPPHIFSSSPFASSQSSLIETGDYKVADRVYAPCFLCVSADKFQAMRMESDDQDLISSPDGVYPDTLEEAYNDHDDTDTYKQREMVCVVFFGSPVMINCMDYSMSPTISPSMAEAQKRTRAPPTFRKSNHCRRSDPDRKERWGRVLCRFQRLKNICLDWCPWSACQEPITKPR